MSPGATTSRDAHEQGLARFLRSNRRARFLAMLADPRTRRTLQRELAHFERRLDPRYARPRSRRKQERHLDSVYLSLVEAALPRCPSS